VTILQSPHIYEPNKLDNDITSRKGRGDKMESSVYNNEFFDVMRMHARRSALRIVPKVLEFVQPTSVIDVGCGTGDFLAIFQEQGIKDILGIDGNYARSSLVISPESFIPCDLCQPFTLDRTFDLAISLEVGEHLPLQSASSFISSLTCLAPVVLFSAAIPYQGGNSHVNEQWPEYWADLFKEQGFVAIDALRADIWHDTEISFWYRQNLLLFCNEETLASNEKLARAYQMTKPGVLSLVHPEMYLQCNSRSQRAVRHMLTSFGRLRAAKGK
jgi:SAM-dependent methyltransferase